MRMCVFVCSGAWLGPVLGAWRGHRVRNAVGQIFVVATLFLCQGYGVAVEIVCYTFLGSQSCFVVEEMNIVAHVILLWCACAWPVCCVGVLFLL